MATLEELGAALIKADAAGDTANAKILATAIQRLRAAPTAPPSEWDTNAPLPEGGMPGPRAPAMLPGFTPQVARDVLAGLFTSTIANNDPMRRAIIEQSTGGTPSTGGGIAGQMLGTVADVAAPMVTGVGVGAGLGRAAAAAGLPTLARGLASGGFAPGLGLGMRTLTGATAGAAGSALEPTLKAGTQAVQNALAGTTTAPDTGAITQNALIGAALGGALPTAVPMVSRAAGAAYDALKGRVGETQAADLVRRVLGPDRAAAQAAMAAAPNELTAIQAAAGINRPEFFALGQDVAASAPAEYLPIMQAQEAARMDALARQAGGRTATEARQAVESGRETLGQLTAPMREQALERANVMGKVGMPLAEQAAAERAAASQAVEDVRRFTAAGERAGERARTTYTVTGQPPVPGRYTYMGDLAKRAEDVTSTAADESLMHGARARGLEARVQALQDMGLKPLDVGAVTSRLRDIASRASNAGNTPLNRVVGKVAEDIAAWTNRNGVIDAEALYAIRKNGINSAIDELLGNADPATKSRVAAQALAEVRPLIDDAIEQAGGAGWRDYLNTFSQGARALEQQQFAAKAMKLAKDNPKKFVALMQGDAPELVEKVFGRGNYDVATLMGDRIAPLRTAAAEIQRDLGVAEAAKAGQRPLRDLLDQERGVVSRFLTRLAGAKTGLPVDTAIAALESNLSASAKEALIKGFKSGKSLNELLSQLPTADITRVRAALAPSGAGFAPLTTNVLAPSQPTNNALSR